MDKYLQEIKNAKSKEELREIVYKGFLSKDITQGQDNIITNCAVWKENQQKGATQDQLNDCAKVLKIPKKYINLIK